MENTPTELGTLALSAMHRRDQELGIDPFAVERSPEPPPQQTRVEQGLRIAPPDWDAERRAREEQERAVRVAEAAALLEEATPPPKPEPPAPKRKAWARSAE